MTAHARRVLLAAGIAPWAVVIVAFLWAVWHYATSLRSTLQNLVYPDNLWEFVLVYSIYGVPTAYLSLVVFLPLYYVARHFGWVSYWAVAAAGLLTCLPAALLYGQPSYLFPDTLIFLLPFGAAIAICFLWIVRRGAEPGASPAKPQDNLGIDGGPPSVS